uniref:NADH dehydrogenase [ubiquinone] 1 beta subcomplex subunit 6 n=1 Tax=Trichogramma kaykai TaxID=54128 RepID=A0ABD2XEJ4_9HYME
MIFFTFDYRISMGAEEPIVNEHGCSNSGGVKVMGIQGRMARERERLIGMTDAERAWRAKWVKDQQLHGEPIVPENFYKNRYNPIRRFYRYPLDKFEAAIGPVVGSMKAQVIRHLIAKCTMGLLFTYSVHYYFKYNAGDWTRKGGWKVTSNRPAMAPGDPDFPNFKDTKPNEYATFGFENSPI